ncbi:von Willebrand factor A domain-containing protein 5A-like [Ambystoma mexicanum]|uniref:von Willebrand factor A domain-containing protein 5A-like n=1 Tax=Ambystoma mexicanum TaxID=8296 RepID=UPI0037E75934
MDCFPACGLLTISKSPVPLKSISVDVQVKGFVADVSATLKYKNEEQNPLEAVFVFPMDDDSAVYSFEATVEGKTIVAEIQEKKQAQETYDEAISQGQEAFLLEEDSSSGDIFSCSVGNLPPGQEASITLSFVRELAVEADGAVRFVLPAVLNPRYSPREAESESITAGIPRVLPGKLPYSLEMNAKVQSAYGVSSIQSNSGLTPLEYLKEDQMSAQVSLAEGHMFDRDVELLIYYNEVNKPSITVEAGLPTAPTGSLMAEVTVMLDFYPNFPESAEQSSCGEFIFVVDRSGSMDCTMSNEINSPLRIDSAKETLLFLLKSLPLGCFFNVFGFGSHFESFFPESVEYTQESMDSALEKVKSMASDFGGTEIMEPLQHIYKQAEKPGHPRQLFIFTDGEVDNTADVIALVQRNNSQHRCFAFGIGEGASTALIKGIARAAYGTCEFITGKERMQPKVLRTLKCSLQPVVTDVSLNWTLPPGLESTLFSQLPNAIFHGQRSIIYAQVKGKIDNVATAEVSLEYTFMNKSFKNPLQFPLQPKNESSLTVHRLAAKSVLRNIDQRDGSMSDEVKKKILETSLQSGVISSLTAFIAVNKDLKQPIQGPLTRRNVPLAYPMMRCMKMAARAAPMCSMMASQPEMIMFDMCADPCPGPLAMPDMAPQPLVGMVPQPIPDLTTPAEQTTSETDHLLELISLQRADGSWKLDGALALTLATTEEELVAKNPGQDMDSAVWATVLALIWLHSTSADHQEEWELLERKALSWVKSKSVPSLADFVKAGNAMLHVSVDPNVFGL